ncbi:MAG TPA: hypothetical protein VFK78_05700 [Gemmatimonadales bacterium]|nr:hypothetical protein [Gemmatimonadales bacterium]
MRRYGAWGAGLVALALAAGCGGSDAPKKPLVNRDTLTERQKDSMLAGSTIPGHGAVAKAMKTADTMSARIETSDTIH